MTVGIWQAGTTGLATWSAAQRTGGVWAVLPLKDGWLAASLYGDRVYIGGPEHSRAIPYPRPLQLAADGHGGAYVLGMLASAVGCLGPQGDVRRAATFPPQVVVTAVLAEKGGVWVAGYDRRRADSHEKTNFYLPEYSTFRWYVQWFPGELTGRELRFRPDAFVYDNDQWHEETAGVWRLLSTHDRLLVVKDQAETVNCLDKQSGRLLWQASTGPRPTGAVIWGDRVLVCSAQAGAVEAYRLDNGGRVWSRPRQIGRGLTGMASFADKVVLTDVVHNRLVLLDPLTGAVLKEIRLDGAPRALAPLEDGLLVGLDAAAQIVRLDWSWTEKQRWNLWPEAAQ